MTVDIFIPCFVDQLDPHVGIDMVKVLKKLGVEVNYNPAQTCCGQPAFNAGYWEEARTVGQKFINDFQTDRYIVSPSASCVGMVRNGYNQLFHNSSLHNECKGVQKNTFEFTEFLVDVLKVTDVGAKFDAKVTYHDSCSGLRECKIKSQPRQLLSKVNGLELVEMNDVETCCGFGGTFAVKFEAISAAMAEQKVNNAIATGAKYVVSTDYSCFINLQSFAQKNGIDLEFLHIASLLARGI